MSRYVNIGGSEYKLTVNSGGTITLDTGTQTGTVIVTGDLHVLGNTTTINSTNLTIEDNIIVLNRGESGAGVSNDTSGISIDRGTLPDALLLFDETIEWVDYSDILDPVKTGAFVLKTTENKPLALQTNAILTNGSNLILIGETSAAAKVTVTGTVDYETHIGDDDDIPNVKWVTDKVETYLSMHPPASIQKGDSTLQLFDSQYTSETVLQLKLDNLVAAEFRPNSFEVQYIKIEGNSISTFDSIDDLIITANGAGNVVINDTMRLQLTSSAPAAATDGIKVYAQSESTAGTGIFFVNTENTKDELISRRKALAFSMIF